MLSNEYIKDSHAPNTREKAQTWNKSDGDRFIPRRTSLNVQDFNLHSMDLSCESDDTRSESSNFSDYLKFSLSEIQTMASSRKFFKYKAKAESRSVVDALSESLTRKATGFGRKRFVLPEKPFKILEAPSISDDFYHNIFDWSSTNILSVCLANSIYMLHADSAQVTKLYEAFDCEAITCLQWNEAGDQLAVGNVLGQVSIWDVNTQKEIVSLDPHEDRVSTIDWRTTMISGSKDATIVQHDFRKKTAQINTYLSHTQAVCKVKWSPDEQYFCSGGNDNKLFIWAPMNAMPIMRESHEASVKALAWSEKQHGILASGGGAADKMIKTWNVRTRELVHERQTGSQVCSLVFSKHTNDLISAHGYPHNEITLWRANGLKKVGSLMGHTERVLYLNLSPCATTLVSGSGDETLRFWKLYDESYSKDAKKNDGALEISNIR